MLFLSFGQDGHVLSYFDQKLSKPDWGKVALEIFQRGSSGNGSPSELASNTQRTSARSDSSTASTNTSSYSMSSCDISEVKRVYNSLDADKCWKLSTGKVVEKEIEKLALSCKFEQYVSCQEKARHY